MEKEGEKVEESEQQGTEDPTTDPTAPSSEDAEHTHPEKKGDWV